MVVLDVGELDNVVSPGIYPQLSETAPTVFSIRPGFTGKENCLLNAARSTEISPEKIDRADARRTRSWATSRPTSPREGTP